MTADGASIPALETLYRARFHRFLRVAEGICGDVELARDAVQDAFASAIRSRHAFRGAGSLDAWVWQIVVNCSRKAARGRLTAGPPERDDLYQAPAVNGSAPDVDVRSFVAALPERQRAVLFLRYYADLDYTAIAQVLGIAPGTVAATLNAAHASVARLLKEVPR